MTVDHNNFILDVRLEGGALLANGHAVLQGLPANAHSSADSHGLILGFKSHKGALSSFDVPLGQVGCERFLALAKSSLYWMSPMYGTAVSDVPRETQFLLLSLPGATRGEAFALLLPLIDSDKFRATLRPPAKADGAGTLVLRIESGNDTVMADSWDGALYVCAGRDPFEVVERGVAVAARLSGGARASREKEVPPALEMFGWCSWDAFYSRVSAAGLQEGLQSLAAGGTPPRFLIIDDGWQQTEVDPQYRGAAAMSLVSGMGHVPSAPQTAAVEEATADLLVGTDMRQREELIGLHEYEEEILLAATASASNLSTATTPRGGPRPFMSSAGPLQAAAGAGGGAFRSLPTTPRRFWGESPRDAGAGLLTPRGAAAAAGPGAGLRGARGSLTSPRPGLRPLGPSSSSLGSTSPRVLAGQLPPGSSHGSLSEEGTPRQPRAPLSPHLTGGPFGNPFRTESPLTSPLASPLLSPGLQPAVPPQTAPPPSPEALARQLEEAAALTSQGGLAPLKTPLASAAAAAAAAGVVDGAKLVAGQAGEGVGAAAAEEAEVPAIAPQPRLGLWGRLLSLLRGAEVAVLQWVRSFLSTATSGSWRMRAFSWLATGPLKPSILRFYATTTDHTRRLQSVKANTKFSHPEAGPEHPLSSFEGEDGLKGVVQHLKRQYSLQYVYCWHAMMGFWAGVAPGAPATSKYEPRIVHPKPTPSLLEVDPSYAWVQPVLAGVGLPNDPVPLHRDIHAFLKASGVDGVKVDVQGVVGLTGSVVGGAAWLSSQYHASLEASVREHFPGNHCINCMCGSSEDLYRMTHTNVARVSDDFYPHMPASWTTHIANCALNSLFCGELVMPDWDMFHSVHPAAQLHATARAISGGPIIVSDRPGVHDFGILSRLVQPDGSVFRCRRHARPTRDCLLRDVLRDGETVLKLWNVNGWGGVVGLFNLQGASWSIAHRGFVTHDPSPPALEARVGPADVARLRPAEQYVLYRDGTQELRVMGPQESMGIALEGSGGCDIVTVSPVLEQAGVRVAPIGLPHMLNASGAVLSCEPGPSGAASPARPARAAAGEGEQQGEAGAGGQEGEEEEHRPAPGVTFTLVVKGWGTLLCYASQRPSSVSMDGQHQAFQYEAPTGALAFDLPAGSPWQKRVVLHFAS